MTNVTVIGLGNMGGAVAIHLAERYPVTGFDLADAARERAAEHGIILAETIAEATVDADVVVTSLPNPAIVRAAWHGRDGIIENAKAGATLVEISTIDPNTMKEVGETARGKGLKVIDSPVSGGPDEALAGTLTLFVGGADEDIAGARGVLDHIGTVNLTGDIGTAKVVKIVNNMMSMANVAAASEAFALGAAAGVEPHRLFEILSKSGGASHHFVKRWPWVLENDYRARFSLEMGEKDLALGVELARAMHMPAPVASTGQALYLTAIADGLAGKDIVALVALYEKWLAAGPQRQRPEGHSPS